MGRKLNYKTLSQNGKFNKCELRILRHLSRRCMSIYKKSIKNIKDFYISDNKYLDKYKNFSMINSLDYYFDVNTEVLQRACYKADSAYQSYFELLKYQKKNNIEVSASAPDFPKGKYMPISFSYLGNKYDENGNRYFVIPLSVSYKHILKNEATEYDKLNNMGLYSDDFELSNNHIIKITIPKVLKDKKIQEVSLIPLYGGYRFKIQYKYVDDMKYKEAKGNNILAIDLGVNNLMSCVDTNGNSFIVDGKRLKSMNQYYNKRLSELISNNPYVYTYDYDPFGKQILIKTLRKNLKPNQKYLAYKTKRINNLHIKRENKVSNYIYKSCRIIIDYCLSHNVSKLVLGYNNDFQKGGFEYPKTWDELSNMDKHYIKNNIKSNNQRFINIPFGKIRNRLNYLCNLHNIELIICEESYTSQASFYDNDEIPVYEKNNINTYTFSGKRIKRGLYVTKDEKMINADINGALNILKKSSVCDNLVIDNLRHRGANTPLRLRVI